ncbi:MAG: MFS transporter [Chloroflexi bacterium]|nr:MFS transporter [Chloroflexota bacterium]
MRISNIPVLVILQDRNFQFLWAARWIHEISRRMELIVLGYLILELTGSAFAVGLISVFLNGPRPPLSLVAGMLADRLDRWRIMVGTHIVYLFIASFLLALLFLQWVEPWHVFLAILLQGTDKVLDDPTRRAALFDIAGQDRITHAMSLEMLTNNGGKIIGPIIGGFMVQFYGFTGAFIVLVVLDVLAAFFIFKMRLPEGSARMVRDTAFLQGIKSGISHSFSNKFVLGVLAVSLIMNGMVFPLQYFIPVVATDVLKVGPALGGVLAAAEGIGSFLGAIVLAGRNRFTYHGRYFIFGALIVAVGVVIVAWSPWFVVSFLVLLTAGMGQSGFSVMQSSILLLCSPPEMRGRIMGSQGLVNGVGHVVGGVEVGAIAQAFSISIAIGFNAGIGILLMLPVIIWTPLVWRAVEAYRRPEASGQAAD